MAIQELNRFQFDAFNPDRNLIIPVRATEMSWFLEDQSRLIGVVVLDHTDNDWNYVVLGGGDDGRYTTVDMGVSFNSQGEAEENLKAAMSGTAVGAGWQGGPSIGEEAKSRLPLPRIVHDWDKMGNKA